METQEQRQRRITEEGAARYARLVRLNEAEIACEQSRAVAAAPATHKSGGLE